MLRSAIAACNICGRPLLRQLLVPALGSTVASGSRNVRTHARRNMAKELLELQKERAAAPPKQQAVPTGVYAGRQRAALGSVRETTLYTVTELAFDAPLSIVLYPDPRLRAVNAKIGVFGEPVKRLAEEMFRVMYEYVCGHVTPRAPCCTFCTVATGTMGWVWQRRRLASMCA